MTTASKIILLAFSAALLAACSQSARAPSAARPAPVAPGDDNLALATDPDALRLQDISSDLLLYVTLHKQMPSTLEDLRPLAGPDLQFTNPATNQPYVYVPTGLSVPEQQRVLVLYDATAPASGWRWGIVASQAQGNQPMTMSVVRLSRQVLNAYLQSAPAGK